MRPSPPRLDCFLLDTGYCLASEHHMIRGGARRQVQCHALAALLHHPTEGWLLWDTGYAPRFLEATRGWPYRLYRFATPVRLDPALAVPAHLARLGLAPADIRRVIISHFHADHVAGLRDFPQAEFIASEAAFRDAAPRHGLRALARAFIPSLVPDDFEARATLLPPFSGPELAPFGPTHDLFGDGSLRLVMLPGHAHGQMGLLAETNDGPMLLVADGAWQSRAIRELRLPHPITLLMTDDPSAVRTTLHHLHDFAERHPHIALVPTHCPEMLARALTGPTA